MSKIFISHSSADNIAAQAMADWLAENGWNEVFLDIDPDRGIKGAERWERALHAAAQRCEAVVFLISRHWLDSKWCGNEYGLARALNKPLFGLLIDRDLTIDILRKDRADLAATWQMINLCSGTDGVIRRAVLPGTTLEGHVAWSLTGLKRLKNGLDKAGLDPKYFPWPPESEPDRSPYPGLRALEAKDAGVFFGRDALLIEAGDKLRRLSQSAAPRIMVLLGASGAGKSSFLRAGLLPRLARDDAHFLPLLPIRPEGAALYGDNGLLGALRSACPRVPGPELRDAIARGAEGVRPLLAGLVEAKRAQMLAANDTRPPPAIVIAIDQAEELMHEAGREESEGLLAMLLALAEQDAPAIIIILTLRADAWEKMQGALGTLHQEPFLLPTMPKGQLKEVIEGPARRRAEAGSKFDIDPLLSDQVMQDAEASDGGDTLPLIAFVLETLYRDHAASGVLTLADYTKSGGIGGAIEAAMARVFRKADSRADIPRDMDQRLALLRRALVPWLAGIDPTTLQPRRAAAAMSDIPQEARPLAELMVEERLLVEGRQLVKQMEPGSGAPPAAGRVEKVATLEPAHEALLRQWGLLKGWLADDIGYLATLEGLRQAAEVWDANGRGESWLAHQGNRLDEAVALKKRPDLFAQLNQRDQSYLSACEAREGAAKAKEIQAAANELALARAEAERAKEKAKFDLAQSKAKYARYLTAVTATVAIALGGLGILAWQQRNDAVHQTAVAIAANKQTHIALTEATREKALAIEANKQTRVALTAATKTADSLVFDIAQKFRNLKGIPVALIGAILDPALKMLDQLVKLGQNDPSVQASQSAVLNEVSITLLSQGNIKEALADALKSRAIMQRLTSSDTGNLSWQRDLGVSEARIGDVRAAQGNLPGALKAYQANYAITQRLAESDPTNTSSQSELAISINKIGDVKATQGDLQGALKAYQASLAIRQRLAVSNPSDANLPKNLWISQQNIGDVHMAEGHLSGALQAYQACLAIMEKLAHSVPTNVTWQDDLAISNEKVGETQQKLGNPQDALKFYQAAVAIRQRLATTDPGNAGWQRDLELSYAHLATIYLAQTPPDTGNARAALTAGRAIIAPLAASHTDVAVYKTDLARIDGQLARLGK